MMVEEGKKIKCIVCGTVREEKVTVTYKEHEYGGIGHPVKKMRSRVVNVDPGICRECGSTEYKYLE